MTESTPQAARIPGRPPSSPPSYAIGDEIHLVITGVTNERTYQSAGKIVSITGNYAKVRYRQPWARPHNCMSETMVDLRNCKKIKRRLRHNALAQPQPPGSQAPLKPESSESPPASENGRNGGCWLERAGSVRSSLQAPM